MKKLIVLIALLLPVTIMAQGKKKVVTEEIAFVALVNASDMPEELKQNFISAYTAAVCEVYNPWTGECDIWMDPDDPLPSTQGIKYQAQRQKATDNFEATLWKVEEGEAILKMGKNSLNVSCAFTGYSKNEKLNNSLFRMQQFAVDIRPFINDGTEPMSKGIGLGELQECVTKKLY